MANSTEPKNHTTWNDFFYLFEKMSLDIFNSDTPITDIIKNIMQPEDAYAVNYGDNSAEIPKEFDKCICRKNMYLTREVEGEDEYIDTFVSNIKLRQTYDQKLQCEVDMFNSEDGQSIMIYFMKRETMNQDDWDIFKMRTKDDLNSAVLRSNHIVRNAFVSEDINQYISYYRDDYESHDIQYTIAVTKKRVIIKKCEHSNLGNDAGYNIKVTITRYDYEDVDYADKILIFFEKELLKSKQYSVLKGRTSMNNMMFTPYKINTEKLAEMFGTFLQGTHERLGIESHVSLLDELVLNKVQILLKSSLTIMKLDIKMSLQEVLNALGGAVEEVLHHSDQDIAGKMPRVLDTRVFI
jgi:hypothetical protein